MTITNGTVYVAAPYVTEESIDFEGNGTVYALKPTGISPPTLPPTPESFPFQTLLMIAVVVTSFVVISLAIYLKKRKH